MRGVFMVVVCACELMVGFGLCHLQARCTMYFSGAGEQRRYGGSRGSRCCAGRGICFTSGSALLGVGLWRGGGQKLLWMRWM